MKLVQITLAVLIGCFAVSCNSPAHVTVTTRAGTTVNADSSGRIGGRGAIIAKADDVTVAIQDNNEDSFREAAKTARFAIGAVVVSSAVGDAASAATSINASKDATTVALDKTAAATAQAKIAAKAAEKAAETAVVVP